MAKPTASHHPGTHKVGHLVTNCSKEFCGRDPTLPRSRSRTCNTCGQRNVNGGHKCPTSHNEHFNYIKGLIPTKHFDNLIHQLRWIVVLVQQDTDCEAKDIVEATIEEIRSKYK